MHGFRSRAIEQDGEIARRSSQGRPDSRVGSRRRHIAVAATRERTRSIIIGGKGSRFTEQGDAGRRREREKGPKGWSTSESGDGTVPRGGDDEEEVGDAGAAAGAAGRAVPQERGPPHGHRSPAPGSAGFFACALR